jgi:hypothetical protein
MNSYFDNQLISLDLKVKSNLRNNMDCAWCCIGHISASLVFVAEVEAVLIRSHAVVCTLNSLKRTTTAQTTLARH